MPLFGTFDTMQLADLLQWISDTRLDGTLTVSVETEETYVLFERGDIRAVSSGDPLRLDVGQLLLARGLIEASKLKEACAQTRDGTPLSEAIIRVTGMEPDELESVRRAHLFEMVLDLFFRDEGSFHLSTSRPGDSLLAPHEMSRMEMLGNPISSRNLVIEAMKRLDDWNRFLEVFPGSHMVVHALDGESDDPVWLTMRDNGDPISVGELCLKVGGSRFGTYRSLYELHKKGLVALDELLYGRPVADHLGPVDMLVDNARLLIEEHQYDEAREVLSTATSLDPDNLDARDLLRSLRVEQLEYLYGQIPPHRVPVLAISKEELFRYSLSARETYLASRLQGRWDVATLVIATPLGELETLRILKKFIHADIARLT